MWGFQNVYGSLRLFGPCPKHVTAKGLEQVYKGAIQILESWGESSKKIIISRKQRIILNEFSTLRFLSGGHVPDS